MLSFYHRNNVEMHVQYRWQIVPGTIRISRHGKVGFQSRHAYGFEDDDNILHSRRTEGH